MNKELEREDILKDWKANSLIGRMKIKLQKESYRKN
jgi:hypothetical protein